MKSTVHFWCGKIKLSAQFRYANKSKFRWRRKIKLSAQFGCGRISNFQHNSGVEEKNQTSGTFSVWEKIKVSAYSWCGRKSNFRHSSGAGENQSFGTVRVPEKIKSISVGRKSNFRHILAMGKIKHAAMRNPRSSFSKTKNYSSATDNICKYTLVYDDTSRMTVFDPQNATCSPCLPRDPINEVSSQYINKIREPFTFYAQSPAPGTSISSLKYCVLPSIE